MPCFSNDDNTLLAVAFATHAQELDLALPLKVPLYLDSKHQIVSYPFHIFWIIINR